MTLFQISLFLCLKCILLSLHIYTIKYVLYWQEYEIDKTLGIKGPDDVAKMGIEKYNNECRKIVMRYSKDWEVNIRYTIKANDIEVTDK